MLLRMSGFNVSHMSEREIDDRAAIVRKAMHETRCPNGCQFSTDTSRNCPQCGEPVIVDHDFTSGRGKPVEYQCSKCGKTYFATSPNAKCPKCAKVNPPRE